MRAPSGANEEDLVAAVPGARRKPGSSKKLLLALVAALLLAAGGGYYFLLAPEEAPPVVVAPKPKLTPSETLNKIAKLPGDSIDKAREVIAARREKEQDRVDAMAAGEEAPAERAIGPKSSTGRTAAPATTQATVTSSSQVAPGVVATTTRTAEVAGDASPAFRTWVANARITGVFQGTPPRALINGRTIRAGQTVDDALGIVFHGIDQEAKTIEFRDATGAAVSRRY